MRFIKLEKLINLHDGYLKTFDINGSSFLLIQKNNNNHLYLNICPHKKQELGENCLHDNIIRCPWHGMEFNAQNGICENESSQHLKLTEFQLAYEENFIGVYTD